VYRVHRFDTTMTGDRAALEQFLNGLDGEVVAIVPNVTMKAFWVHVVDVPPDRREGGLIGARGRSLGWET